MSGTNKKTLFALTMLGFCSGANAQSKPNIVFIIADQFRGTALSCLGKEPVHTPALDKLASEGCNFTNAVSAYPVSSPARAMLMTGKYPIHNKVIANCNTESGRSVELEKSARCWSDVLKSLGYNCGYIGKWHLDAPYKPYIDTYNNKGKIKWNEWCSKDRRHGFDYWLAYGTYDRHLKPMYWDNDAKRNDFFYVNEWGPRYEADKAIDFIKENKNHPFALVVSMNPPHSGYNLVPQKYKDIYKNLNVDSLCNSLQDLKSSGKEYIDFYKKNIANYYACISGVDANISRIIKTIDSLGLRKNTLIVFTSDHGVSMGRHKEKGKNRPFEECMRIPLIMSYKDKIPVRTDSTTMIAIGDLYPTMLSIMGLSKYIPKDVETYNFSKSILKGESDSLRIQPYYRIQPRNSRRGYRGFRDWRYTFVLYSNGKKIDSCFLYDRKTDPFMLKNIADKHEDMIENYTKRLRKFLDKTGDPFIRNL